jgi:hypothetical protein
MLVVAMVLTMFIEQMRLFVFICPFWAVSSLRGQIFVKQTEDKASTRPWTGLK